MLTKEQTEDEGKLPRSDLLKTAGLQRFVNTWKANCSKRPQK